jgi:acylphosphatase
VCREFIITGRVQGVFFRASTRDVATPLGIKGHAINLEDGTVEVRACGDDAAVEQLRDWLSQGPRQASVTDVVERPTECTHPDRFSTG